MSNHFFGPQIRQGRSARLYKPHAYSPEEEPLPVSVEVDTIEGQHVLRTKTNGFVQISEGGFVKTKRSGGE